MPGTGRAARDRLIVAVDVGGSSTKASVFDLQGRVHGVGRVDYQPAHPEPGAAEYDATEILAATEKAIAEAAAQVDVAAIEAVSVDAMMSGMVPLGASGAPVAAYTTTLDTRFTPQLEHTLRVHGERVRALTGSGQPTLGPKIAWLQRAAPAVAARTASYGLASTLVVGHLAGLGADQAVVDLTHIWTTGLADLRTGDWDPQLCAAQGVDRAQLPRIAPPTEIVGGVSPAVAAVTGLRSGTPVLAGCGDQPAGYVGAGATELGRAADSAGTYAVFAAVTGAPSATVLDGDPDLVPTATGSRYNVQVMVIGGGLTRQWSQEILGTAETAADSNRQLATAAAESGVGARGARFLPHLGGLAYPAQPDLRGSWLGLTWGHTRGDMYRAVLESVALSHAHLAAAMPARHPDVVIDEVAVYGGGASSALWNQIKADALGVDYVSLGDAPVAGLGAAMLGAQAVGLVDDAGGQALRSRTVVKRFRPDPARHERYRTLLSRYARDVEVLGMLDPALDSPG